jgi:hypothetical protein
MSSREATMPTIIADEQMAAKLTVNGPHEIRTADGRVLGQFMPAPRPGMMFPEFGMTDEEMDQLVNDPNAKWYTPDEVMARLRELG